jgi:hypothetical protein
LQHCCGRMRCPDVLRWRADHDLQEMLYGLFGVVREAGVDGRGLHHGAAGRDEPPEALDRGQ